jgi:Arc/MetJ family transcription regulator
VTPSETLPLPELGELLAGLAARLEALPVGQRACFELQLRKIREMQDLLAVSSRPNWEYLRRKLREIDDDVSAAVLEALAPEERAAVEAEASRAADRYRGRLDPEALEDARARLQVQRGRERLGLVRVAVS